jgi:lipopolysaccharide transport system ATP-binding protein
VAAHLEPEILLMDEVLAVGDVGFQKKCLGKMGDVAKEGRTVLFVSHNMQAVKSLCKSVFQLEGGQLIRKGDPEAVVAGYLRTSNEVRSEVVFPDEHAPGNDELKLTGIRVFSEDNNACGIFSSDRNLYLEIQFIANTNHSALCVGFDLVTPEGTTVLRSYQTDLPPDEWPLISTGENRWTCTIPAGFLNAGVYYVSPRIGMHNMYWIVKIDVVVQFEIVLDHGVSPLWNSLGGRNRPGVIAPILNWGTNSSDRNACYAHSEPSGKRAQSST